MISCAPDAFTIGIVYVKPLELFAITPMLDERYSSVPVAYGDNNTYILGRIGAHNVVIVGPARGDQGTIAAAQFITSVNLTFPNVNYGLLVGIGGGIPHYPEHDVRLGDVVVGAPETGPAIVHYNLGKRTAEGTEAVRTLARPPSSLLRIINSLEDKYMSRQDGEEDVLKPHLDRLEKFPRLKHYRRPCLSDRLFQAEYSHPIGSDCAEHDTRFELVREPRDTHEIVVHYSTILSGDLVMKSSADRDHLSRKYYDALCIEMEAAGLMDVFPCLVIRGICDYADSHKMDGWQRYAAATAAAYAREVLLNMPQRVPKLFAAVGASVRTDTASLTRSTQEPVAASIVIKSASLAVTGVAIDTDQESQDKDNGKRDEQSLKPLIMRKDETDEPELMAHVLEKKFYSLNWFKNALRLDGFCFDMGIYGASTLDDMMVDGNTIRLSSVQLVLYQRPKPFAQGSTRLAFYARTEFSTNKLVVTSYRQTKHDTVAQILEDIQIQAMCKAFALEFDSFVEEKHAIDFVVTNYWQHKTKKVSSNSLMSIEPYLNGEYIKYNDDAGWVSDQNYRDPISNAAQAFSHFTFERSFGQFMVTNLGGIGSSFTNPVIHAKDPKRFRLSPTNAGVSGFKSFFETHECNLVCKALDLKSDQKTFVQDVFVFGKSHPTPYKTVCCSNKLCLKIVQIKHGQSFLTLSDSPGYYWCLTCWAQLESTTVKKWCKHAHYYEFSQFFYESQGQDAPSQCAQHRGHSALSQTFSCEEVLQRHRDFLTVGEHGSTTI